MKAKTTRLTKKNIATALARLGATSTNIAASLKILKIRGTTMMSGMCPLAQYLREMFDLSEHMDIYVNKINAHVGPLNVPLTDAQIAFVQRFDGGDFPALIQH